MRPCERGFSLLEVLVALSVLALSLGVLMQIFSSAMRGVTLAEHYSKATLIAQSRLAAVGTEYPAEPGSYSGDEGGFRWIVNLSPSPVAVPATGSATPLVELLDVRVGVVWAEGERERSVAVDSLRVANQLEVPR